MRARAEKLLRPGTQALARRARRYGLAKTIKELGRQAEHLLEPLALEPLELLELGRNEHPALRVLLRSLREVGAPNHASSIRKKHLITRYTTNSVPSAPTM